MRRVVCLVMMLLMMSGVAQALTYTPKEVVGDKYIRVVDDTGWFTEQYVYIRYNEATQKGEFLFPTHNAENSPSWSSSQTSIGVGYYGEDGKTSDSLSTLVSEISTQTHASAQDFYKAIYDRTDSMQDEVPIRVETASYGSTAGNTVNVGGSRWESEFLQRTTSGGSVSIPLDTPSPVLPPVQDTTISTGDAPGTSMSVVGSGIPVDSVLANPLTVVDDTKPSVTPSSTISAGQTPTVIANPTYVKSEKDVVIGTMPGGVTLIRDRNSILWRVDDSGAEYVSEVSATTSSNELAKSLQIGGMGFVPNVEVINSQSPSVATPVVSRPGTIETVQSSESVLQDLKARLDDGVKKYGDAYLYEADAVSFEGKYYFIADNGAWVDTNGAPVFDSNTVAQLDMSYSRIEGEYFALAPETKNSFSYDTFSKNAVELALGNPVVELEGKTYVFKDGSWYGDDGKTVSEEDTTLIDKLDRSIILDSSANPIIPPTVPANDVKINTDKVETFTYYPDGNSNSETYTTTTTKRVGDIVTEITTFVEKGKDSVTETITTNLKTKERTIISNGVTASITRNARGQATAFSITTPTGTLSAEKNVVTLDGNPVGKLTAGKFIPNKDADPESVKKARDLLAQGKKTQENAAFNAQAREYQQKRQLAMKSCDGGPFNGQCLVEGWKIPGTSFSLMDLRLASDFASGFSGYAGFFMSDEKLAEWRSNVDNVFAYVEPAGWAEQVCQMQIPDDAPIQTAFVKLPDGSISPAAAVQAHCALSTDNFLGETQYLYRISGRVVNTKGIPPETPLEFNIRLYGEREVDLLERSITLAPNGSSFVIDKTMQAQYSSYKYDKICITFQTPPDFIGSSTVCNRITCQNETAAGYASAPTRPLPNPVQGGEVGAPAGCQEGQVCYKPI